MPFDEFSQTYRTYPGGMVERSSSSDLDSSGEWETLLEAERTFFCARRQVTGSSSLDSLIDQALRKPSERGTALRLLLVIDVAHRMTHFSQLVELASVGHADVALCREAIGSIPRYWTESNIRREVLPLLAAGDAEEYRRIAELLVELRSPLLEELVEMASDSDDEDINEVGVDFTSSRHTGLSDRSI